MRLLSLLLFALIIVISQVTGQSFTMEAQIDSVKEDGNYQILITPEVSTHLKQDFSDLRIYDTKNNEVPYFLKIEKAPVSTESFRSYEIIEHNKVPGCCTQLIIRNSKKNKIDNIGLIIKNADVRKKARLSGSDDKVNWYTIKDNYELESLYNDQKTEEVKILHFPLSDYEYFRLDISDSLSLPISILQAGYYDILHKNATWLDLPAPDVVQTDSIDKKSYVKIAFQSPQYIDRIKFNISGPDNYLRRSKLCTRTTNSEKSYFTVITTFELRSNHSNEFLLDNLFEQELYLIIDNKDNPPLSVESVDASQIRRTVIAHLQKDNNYVLRFGDKNASLPDYDLKYFNDKLTIHPKVLKVDAIEKIEFDKVQADDFFTTKLWVWAAVIGMVLLLAYFSVKMIREIK